MKLPEDIVYLGHLCFEIRSRSRARLKLRVDLKMYDYNGCCGCENFEFNHAGKLERGERDPFSDRLRCHHIKRIRSVLLDWNILPSLMTELERLKP